MLNHACAAVVIVVPQVDADRRPRPAPARPQQDAPDRNIVEARNTASRSCCKQQGDALCAFQDRRVFVARIQA